ncbi:MAG TPA: DNA repair protein RecN [Candidatus Aquilonibacter sp.]|nr:DNA repair protein RecN [Candidatus Aquilonibacter sp.]
MLRRLEIKDYGLVPSATIEFADGATIFTGETGSGKTMVLGAIACVLGARASADNVKRGASRAVLTLTFEPDEPLRERLCADGFDVDPGEEASVVREITEAGKSSVRVNGRAATASYVREIAPFLAELVGQHEAQRLLLPAYQLEILDRFGGQELERARTDMRETFDRWSAANRELARAAGNEQRAQAEYEDARHALDELAALAPQAGEDERLTERRRYLDNVERIAAALRTAHDALGADDASAGSALGLAASALQSVVEMSGELQEMSDHARAMQSEVHDLATRIARALDDTEFEPGELEHINERLEALDRAKRRYGPTIDALLAYEERAKAIVAAFEGKDERIATLARDVERTHREVLVAAAALTKHRETAAKRLSRAVVAEFKELALGSARFEVSFSPIEPVGALGAQSAEFLFAANAGEDLRPLARVASGGELSRVLLALVVALASGVEQIAMIFDEIDAGIGGATATAVGARLGRLSKNGQVVCVTHLAQLATWAQRHYVLEKHEARGSTTISVREIAGEDERTAELARMLSGQSHAAALEHARALLKSAT